VAIRFGDCYAGSMPNTPILGRSARAAALTSGIFLIGLATGCTNHHQVFLLQDFAPPSQQRLALTSEVAAQADRGTQQTCVFTFPLPGAERGPRAFVLYLRLPAGKGTFGVGPNGVGGFLVQEVGDLAGRTDITGGTVRAKGVWLRPSRRVLELDLTCSDGSAIRGKVTVTSDGGVVRALEQEFAADVRRLDEVAELEESATDVRPTDEGGRTSDEETEGGEE
jgi:hypothetical protein